MADTETELLNFEDFRREVGASNYSVRVALAVLGLSPVTQGRRTFYRREWVEKVRDQIERKRP